MKASVFLASLVSIASAQEVIITTEQECWKGEGGRYIDPCSDVYFHTCDNYEVDSKTSCNVYTFSDSRVTWLSNDISASYWEYYKRSGVEITEEDPITGADFGDQESESRCFPGVATASVYKKGEVMNHVGGMCGYKFQLINANENFSNKFKILKDQAVTLLTGSAALALTALYVF